tara:strand:+ start:45 stop:584 length:540 start_codon:yes stop_codon:yes gene_type:complete
MKSKYIILGLTAWCLTVGSVMAQDKNVKKDVKISLKDGAEPDVYIDGIKYDHAIISLLDPSKIKSMNVLKGDKALEEYNAPNGVILITSTNSNEEVKSSDAEFKIRKTGDPDPNASTTIKIRGGDGEPLVIIDGKVSTKEKLNQLDPTDIEKIDVIKDEKAKKEYNSETGVIIITTKKK